MKTKKNIVTFILLAGLATALTACGKSNIKNTRVPTTSGSAAGSVGSVLQGYWVGTCGSEYINSQVSIEFDGTTFKQYQDQYSSSDCSDDYPLNTIEVDGTFQVSTQGGQGYVQMAPNNGQAASVEEYFLSGNVLQFGSTDSSGITTFALGSYTKYTGN